METSFCRQIWLFYREMASPGRKIASPGREITPPGREITPPSRKTMRFHRSGSSYYSQIWLFYREIASPGRKITPPGRERGSCACQGPIGPPEAVKGQRDHSSSPTGRAFAEGGLVDSYRFFRKGRPAVLNRGSQSLPVSFLHRPFMHLSHRRAKKSHLVF